MKTTDPDTRQDGPVTSTDAPWHQADLVALDLEGSGAQDRDNEAILEIALVPLTAGKPAVAESYATLVNPGRSIPARPWISPGLTNDVLSRARPLTAIEPELADRINGRWLVGHNIGVDWRLLHRRCPDIAPAGLIDTLRLARACHLDAGGHSLTTLLDHLELTATVTGVVPHGQPHRALWDTVGAAILLGSLVTRRWPTGVGLAGLRTVAALPDVAPTQAPDTLF
ncbi:3'-5' exonuclease [Couchioplanes caeruleus]|uniref:DNA polymerase III subunit epsilon n=2 Tax=Couchioplanes caeruleus TaxID=56438 RepID=A0A1K0G0C0_9ACTN|nr:3'-5' exonuclease [Couchioplanes caeruleus]OJF10754.1 DNA polymerase III subunit epsilon [Couchioplanes caeruleus subsp. caeruleus]ROP28144.1 DNA polymerase-3 subunit epsilon/exodeoxyribonuclease X [Couchioplanes caeruleus]